MGMKLFQPYYYYWFGLLLVSLLVSTVVSNGEQLLSTLTNTTFAQRVDEHNNYVRNLNSTARGPYGQPVLAYLGQFPLDVQPIQDLLNQVGPNNTNSDFSIVILLRILYLTDSSNRSTYYRNWITPVLQSERYWYSRDVINDDTMQSENHMILWMSSAWLLREREPTWSTTHSSDDPYLKQRLSHYLSLKAKYGYYEFLSITYLPFTFGGLLNLVDFALDPEIQSLADAAIRRLVSDYLLFVNNRGIHFTVAGREYAERFIEPPYIQPMDGIVYLLTGLGRLEYLAIGFSSFLSTSKADFGSEIAQWQSSIDTTYRYGHTLLDSFEINAQLNKYDRIVFQFSQGAYMHPLTIADSIDFIKFYGPIKVKDLKFNGEWLPPSGTAKPVAKLLKRLTYGTVWSGNSIQLYRQGGSMLTSVSTFWPGHIGGQTFPWMAVADELPVWTQSGAVTTNWLSRVGSLTNSHLPKVVQVGNMALIIYKPFQPMPLRIWGDVALNWPEQRFDEVRTVSGNVADNSNSIVSTIFDVALGLLGVRHTDPGSWVLGRSGDSYIAVYRPCGDAKKKGWYACNGDFGRQLWAVVVGDASRYGTFDAFATVVESSTIESSFRRRFLRKPIFVTRLKIEATEIRDDW